MVFYQRGLQNSIINELSDGYQWKSTFVVLNLIHRALQDMNDDTNRGECVARANVGQQNVLENV